jgi:glutaredoxin 3
MLEIEVFTTNYCPYCVRAKDILKKHHLNFVEIDLTDDPSGRLQLVERSGGRKTVPQIFINDQHIGGCDDLIELEQSGQLQELIAQAGT